MINKLFKNRYLLIVAQYAMLFVFVLLIYGSIGITTSDRDFALVLRNTNLANLIVWSYWWPMIIATAIIFGRYWCSICPMELITSLFGKIGLRKKAGKTLKSGWVITVFYMLILVIGIHTLAIHRIPQYMAIYMLLLLVVAILAGLIWEKRTFCTHICPIGHLLGLYSMFSNNQLRVKDIDVCHRCQTKDCISKSNHYKSIGRSCTSELYPATLHDNRDCILCGQCHKSCTKDNIAIQKRRLGTDLFSDIKLSWAEIAFFILLSGFVVYEVVSEWRVGKEILMIIPNWVNHSIDLPDGIRGTTKAVILFILIPTIFYSFFAFLKKTVAKESWKTTLTQLVIVILPITASMHLLKALLKTTSRIPYWEYALSDPKGIESAQSIINNPSLLNKDILISLSPVISIIAILLSFGGLILSLLIIRKQNPQNLISKLISIIALLVYTGIFLSVLIAWRVMPLFF